MVSRLSLFARWVVRIAGRSALPLAAIAMLGAPPAWAQQSDIPPPKAIIADPNGVDLLSGDVSFSQLDNSIGPKGPGSLSSSRVLRASGPSILSLHSYIKITDDGTNLHTTLVLDGRSQSFSGAAPFASPEGDSVGRFSGTSSTGIIYTAPDGTKAVFQYVALGSHAPAAVGVLKSITYPTGETVTYQRIQVDAITTILRVESSLGYVLLTDYTGLYPIVSNLTTGNCADTDCGGIKYSSQYALGRADQISSTAAPGASSYTVTVSSAAGDVRRVYTMTPGAGLWPGDSGYRVSSVSTGGGTWTYAYAYTQDSVFPDAEDGIFQVTVTDPNGVQRIVRSRISNGHVLSDRQGVTAQDPTGRLTAYSYQYDDANPGRPGFGRVTKVLLPGGDAYEYAYDGYANIVSRKHYPKSGSSLSPTEMTASYSCRTITSPATQVCNQPDWIRDENGRQTDFTYGTTHSGVLTVTKPAGPNGVRPQTRYTYTQVQAYYFKEVNGVSGYVSGAPAWRLQSTSTCRTQATCSGTADELVTDYVYESGTSATHNARLKSVTTRAGDNSVSSTTTYSYNDRGDVTVTDGPLPGDGDVTQTHYDLSRWVVGSVGSDPDGSSGSQQYRATKTVYRADGQVQTAYTGVVADRLGDTFTNSFQVKSSVTNEYDGYGRVIAQVSANGSGATFGLTETSYDSFGRVDCVAVRMDASKFGNRLAACSAGANGSNDPDRITKTTYDKYGQVAAVQTGYGVAPIFDRRTTYTSNGQVETETDGKGNVTTYAYDGLDRLQRVTYPGTSADFEEYGYDNAGNVTSRTLRGGGTVISTYDNLGRLWTRNTPTADVDGKNYTYGYDNFGNPTSISDGTRTTSRSYDALSRLVWEQDNALGAASKVSYEYDPAGQRTKLTWPDTFFVAYDYDNTGALTGVRRAGSTSAAEKIAGYSYDDLGRRVSMVRGDNKVSTSYIYNPANLLLQSLTQTPSSAGDAVTYSFAYNAAGQIRQRTIGNSAYNWNGAYIVNRPYESDGLNRYTSAGAPPVAPATTAPGYSTYGYDLRGNLKCLGARSDLPACSNPTTTYSYDSENRLRGVGSTSSFVYDPLGRLFQSTINGTTTRYLYDGPNLIGEYAGASATPLRRYVFGAAADEVLARYDVSSSTPDAPRWLLADHQGSIIAETNENGAVTAKLTYDEYGVPGPGNVGLFQYTGQVYLSGPDLYHYKARAYSPTLGRFLQTDPTGYDDGLNWYAYVGNDPLNRTDPSGLAWMTDRQCSTSSAPGGPGEIDKIILTCQTTVSYVPEQHDGGLKVPVFAYVTKTWADEQSKMCARWQTGDKMGKVGDSMEAAGLAGSIAAGRALKNARSPQQAMWAAIMGDVSDVVFLTGGLVSTTGDVWKAGAGDGSSLTLSTAVDAMFGAAFGRAKLGEKSKEVISTAAGQMAGKLNDGGDNPCRKK